MEASGAGRREGNGLDESFGGMEWTEEIGPWLGGRRAIDAEFDGAEGSGAEVGEETGIPFGGLVVLFAGLLVVGLAEGLSAIGWSLEE